MTAQRLEDPANDHVLTDEDMYARPIEELMRRNACAICLGVIDAGSLGNAMGMGSSWTLVHGVAEHRCGAQYRVLHYEDDKPVAKPPKLLVHPEFVEAFRAYWKQYHTSFNPSGKDDRAYENLIDWREKNLTYVECLYSIIEARQKWEKLL